MDEIPASEEPVQVTDQILLEDESTRVLKPEIQEDHVAERGSVIPQFDVTKLSYELQQGYRIYMELLADSNRNVTWPFLEAVDAESLGLWDYYERIKEPMCFATIGSKFTSYKYQSITEVVGDMRLILENCYRYNGPGHWVSKLGQKLEKILEQKLALLNRSLRDKVTLLATLSLNGDSPLVAELEASGRRRSVRQNYLSMVNGENSSSLVNHVKIQEESEEKERRRQREKEKKEANQALLQDLVEWENKELTPETLNQLHSMWEIPSIGSFLYLVRNILGLEDINLTEFELSFIYPNKSSLLSKIFTALLITPHQRKSLYKKPVMKFRRWESKLKEKVDVWYKLADRDSLYAVSLQYGIDVKFFDILGKERNPLEDRSYLDLTLYQRIWLLKTLCDVCFHRDYDLREKVNSCDFMEQRELFLGHDAKNRSYIYFPVFQTTDVRIYQHDQLEVPLLTAKAKELSPPASPTPERKKSKKTPTRPPTPAKLHTSSRPGRSLRLRQLRSDTTTEDNDEQEDPPNPESPETMETESKPDPLPELEVQDGFKLACRDIETLKVLAEQFAQPPTTPKKRGRRAKLPPSRKQCEIDLHETLLALLQELEKYEGVFSRNYTKARIKIMKESLEPEAVEEPVEVPVPETIEEWGSELSDEDDGAKRDAKDEDFRIEDEYGIPINLDSKQLKAENEIQLISDDSENNSVKSVQTFSPRHRRKHKLSEENTETPSSTNCNIGIQTPNPRLKKKAKKWSPTKETVINSKSVSFPAVVISALSAEESVKAATVPRKGVSIVKALSCPSSSEEQTIMSPKMILLKSLGESLKRAKSNSSSKTQNSVDDSSRIGVEDITTRKTPTSDVTSKTSPSSSPSSSLPAQNLRKRVLVSPEGKTHEVKPCVTIECASPITTAVTPSIHPPIQRKTTVQTVSNVNRELTTRGISATPITVPRTIAKVPQNRVMQAIVSSAAGSTQRPNILARSRKQFPGKSGVVTPQTTGSPIQGTAVTPTSSSVSHNHAYALPSSSTTQGSMAIPQHQNHTGLGMDKARAAIPTVKMVQVIPNSTQSNIAKVSSLYAVPSTISKFGAGFNTLPKEAGVAGLPGVTAPKALQGTTASNLSSHPKTAAVETPQASSPTASTLSKTAVISKGAVSVIAKAIPSKQTPGQTKVVFIPASSVDAKSPLASFTPQTLTTTNGQSIFGYAVVVPPGSPEEVNAVISSALRIPSGGVAKPTNIRTQQIMKTANAVDARKIANTSLGIANTSISQLRLGVPTCSATLHSAVATNTTQPRPGIPTNATQLRPAVATNTTQPRMAVANGTTQPRPGASTNSTQPHPGVSTTSTLPRPGVPTSSTPSRLGVATSTMSPRAIVSTIAQLRQSIPTFTAQLRPGFSTIITTPRSDLPPSSTSPRLAVSTCTPQPTTNIKTTSIQTIKDVPDTATHLRPGVPTSSIPPRLCAPASTTKPQTDVASSYSPNNADSKGLLSASDKQSCLGVATTLQKSTGIVVPVSVSSNALVDSSNVQFRIGAGTNAQSRILFNTSTQQSSNVISLKKSPTQPSSVVTSSQKTAVIHIPVTVNSKPLLNSSASQPCIGVATTPQMPSVLNTKASLGSNFVFGSINLQTTKAYSSSVQDSRVPVPIASCTGSSPKVSEFEPNNQRTDGSNAMENAQNSGRSDTKTTPNSTITSKTDIKNGPLNNSSAPQNNFIFGAKSSTGHLSNNESSSKAVKQTSFSSEKHSYSDNLNVNPEDQMIMIYCNGVLDHPSLNSIVSKQNIKHIESNTSLTDVSSANGIPENRGTTPCSAAVKNK